MQVPDNLLYASDHEWIRVEGNEAVIGITYFAQSELGDVVYVDISAANKALRVGEAFGTIEAIKTVSDLFLPISGKIISVNEKIEDHAELVNSDPYGDGWMIRISITKEEELDRLLSPDQYKALIKSS